MDIHERVEKDLGGLPPTSSDPGTVNEFNRRLAEGIRARRAGAKRGDLCCYPLGAPLSTVPATLLQRLPPLPEELRFRFVGTTLILRDFGSEHHRGLPPQRRALSL
jgi:hypothetical protein